MAVPQRIGSRDVRGLRVGSPEQSQHPVAGQVLHGAAEALESLNDPSDSLANGELDLLGIAAGAT